MSNTNKKIYLGKIVSTHGIKGYFKIKYYSESEIEFLSYKNFFMIENCKINIEKKFTKGNILICYSNQIDNKTQALNLIGKEVWVKESELKKSKTKEYFHKDIINCLVIDQNKKKLGIVKAVHNFGAGDLLELDSNYKYMIRFEDLIDNNIDMENKVIIINQAVLNN